MCAPRALQSAASEDLAGEAAEHWQAAGRPAEELIARVSAAGAAERIFGYAQAAAHWVRAIELCQAHPGQAGAAGIDVPRMYVRAIDALEISGDRDGARMVAEAAYRRFAGHPDVATAAVIHHRAAFSRGIDTQGADLPLLEEALRLFELAPPSADQARAVFDYATRFLYHAEGLDGVAAALNRAMKIAEASGATDLIPRIMGSLAVDAFFRGRIDEGFAIVRRERAAAEASGNAAALLSLAIPESATLLEMGQFQRAAEAALRVLQIARRSGREATVQAATLAANAAQAMLASGRTAEAAALIGPLTTGPPDGDYWQLCVLRAEIDLLRGDAGAAAERRQQVNAVLGRSDDISVALEAAQRAADAALWTGRPADAIQQVKGVLGLFKTAELAFFCGRLLGVGMRACADLAESARARRDDAAARAALADGAELVSWVARMGGMPFTEHPNCAAIPAERTTWDAEQTRLAGFSDPAAWAGAAKTWQDLGCPHRAAYALWRQADAQLNAGQPASAAAAALQAAALAADGHAPLLAHVRALAQRCASR